MSTRLAELNQQIHSDAPAVWQCLSPVGREAIYPADIPFQAAQARDAEFNATIGQITDGMGTVLQLAAVTKQLSGLSDKQRNASLLYSPIGGFDELRTLWSRRERASSGQSAADTPATSRPLITAGLTHALALAADLFGGPGRAVLIPDPCWGNYNQVFGLRTGSRMIRYPIYDDGAFDPRGVLVARDQLVDDEVVTVMLNYPSNPGGYMPTVSERRALVAALVELAQERPVVAICDDAYAGLVFDDEVPAQSLFWDLLDQHEQLTPIRGSGATKEFLLFGARVGFLTFPFADPRPAMQALDSKLRCLLRASIGSPVALAQQLLLQALRTTDAEQQVQEHIAVLRQRFESMRAALRVAEEGASGRWRLLPANAGAFQLLELADGLDSEQIRQRLLKEHSTGVVAIAPRYLRLAFCSVGLEQIEPLVDRVVAGIG